MHHFMHHSSCCRRRPCYGRRKDPLFLLGLGVLENHALYRYESATFSISTECPGMLLQLEMSHIVGSSEVLALYHQEPYIMGRR